MPFMNNNGFPKNNRFLLLDGTETTGADAPDCTTGSGDHDFMCCPAIQKTDAVKRDDGRDGKDMVVMSVYVCRHCLLHAYAEIIRMPQDDAQADMFVLENQQSYKM